MAVHPPDLDEHGGTPEPPVAAGTSPVTVPAVTASIKVAPAAKPSRNIPLFNREFSWLEFNRRVLAEAENPSVPLLERLKFLSIAAANLDEFFMVRVSGVRDLMIASIMERTADGLTPKQQLKGIRERAGRLLLDLYACLKKEVMPELKRHNFRIDAVDDLSKRERTLLRDHFRRNLAPILTPLAIDPGHPFPFLSNLTLNLAVKLGSSRGEQHIVFIKVPPQIPRFVPVPDADTRFVALEDLIAAHAGEFFPGLEVERVTPFRVIRNSDLSIREDEVEDLLKSVESELQRRDRKEVVWIEVGAGAEEELIDLLITQTRSAREDVFVCPGLLKVSDLMQIYTGVRKASLKDEPFNPRIPSQLASSEDIFSIVRTGDIMLHRPYDSFTAVVEFVQAAAEDPDVLAIKITLYRVDANSPILQALAQAAIRGKQVTAIVELQARFDEKRNIAWAKQLEEAGVQVVYGLVGIKTHCKICLIVRREPEGLRGYVHLSTGNYNATTGRLYTDLDLFTCEEAFADDAAQMMNLLTGFSISTVQQIFDGQVPELVWKRLIVAPMDYRRWVIDSIEREIRHQKEGKPAGITAKMNSLVDPAVIEALYRASQAGVKIDLIVRGICCLVPGVEGLSDRISVTAVIDRFLEHSRVFLFRNGGDTEAWLSSGDWMPRNFIRRFEVTYPILDPALKTRLQKQILQTHLEDNVKAWKLNSDGTYTLRTPSGNKAVRSQDKFIDFARKEAVRLAPYDEILTMAGSARRKAKKLRKKDKK
jgi:polyphosphate kinase